MRIGQKLRDAITSSFIEVRLDEETPSPTAPMAVTPVALPELVPQQVVAPEPEPVPEPEPDPLAPPDISATITPEGNLNDQVIYGSANLSQAPFTAEQAIEVLIEMPYGVTARGRCQAMEQAISVTTNDPSSAGHLVVSDAAQKMVALNQYLTRNREQLKTFRRNIAEEMERLHERLNQLRILVDETNANHQALDEAARVRVDNLTGVIAFFDEFQAYLRQQEEENNPQETSELPAYLREDTARKLLKIDKEAA